MIPILLSDQLCTLKLGAVCGSLISNIDEQRLVVGLCGTLGTGKTTFTKGLAQSLGIKEPVSSPTFTMLSEYIGGVVPLYHFDLYRLSEPGGAGRSVEELSYEMAELLETPGVVVVEWIDLYPQLLEGVEDVRLNFSHCEDGSRLVMIEGKNRVSLAQQIRDRMASDT